MLLSILSISKYIILFLYQFNSLNDLVGSKCNAINIKIGKSKLKRLF